MTTLREAAQQALEALDGIHPGNMTPMAEEAWNEAITALRAALAEPQEPGKPVAVILSGKSISWRPCDISGLPTGTLLYTSPQPRREPLTGDLRREIITRAWNEYLQGNGDDSFGWYLSLAVEAAHGITGEMK